MGRAENGSFKEEGFQECWNGRGQGHAKELVTNCEPQQCFHPSISDFSCQISNTSIT
jgi:hypothetical protein